MTLDDTRSERNIVCPFCSCACDDLQVTIAHGQIVDVAGGCELGKPRFMAVADESGSACLVDGQPVSFDVAIERTVDLLRAARAPLIHGLSEATAEAQSLAVTIAEHTGATIDTAHGRSCCARGTPLQTVGASTCTLGELRDRADLIVCWRVDPRVTHPRFFERYTRVLGASEKTFVGNALRGIPVANETSNLQTARAIFIDDKPPLSTDNRADTVRIKPGSGFEAACILRALIQGSMPPDVVAVERQTGVTIQRWQALADELQQAKYGVFLLGPPDENSGDNGDVVDSAYEPHAVHSLAIDLCKFTRFSCITFPTPGNLTAADAVLTWRTGYPFAVDLSTGDPRFGPREFASRQRIDRGECDLVMSIAEPNDTTPSEMTSRNTTSTIAADAAKSVKQIAKQQPTITHIQISDQPCEQVAPSTVVIRTARWGLSSPGTMFRMDGVPLPLRTLVASKYPALNEVLAAIAAGLKPPAPLAATKRSLR